MCDHKRYETYQTTDGLDGPMGGPFGKFGTKCSDCGLVLSTGHWDGTRTIDKSVEIEVSKTIKK